MAIRDGLPPQARRAVRTSPARTSPALRGTERAKRELRASQQYFSPQNELFTTACSGMGSHFASTLEFAEETQCMSIE